MGPGRFLRGLGARLQMKLMVIPVGRTDGFKSQFDDPLKAEHPVLKGEAREKHDADDGYRLRDRRPPIADRR